MLSSGSRLSYCIIYLYIIISKLLKTNWKFFKGPENADCPETALIEYTVSDATRGGTAYMTVSNIKRLD